MSASETITTEADGLCVAVAEDKLSAWVELPAADSEGVGAPTIGTVSRVLEAAGVEMTDGVRARAQEFVQLFADEESELPERFVIAEGRAARDAIDARFEWHETFRSEDSERDSEEQVNYYELSSIITVQADTAIGVLHEATDGVPGYDVFGDEIRPGRLRGRPLQLGRGLKLSETTKNEVIATAAGRVIESTGEIRVDEVLSVAGDVNFETGNVNSPVSVEIRGTVHTKFAVHTDANLTVSGTIEAADVTAGGDVTCLKGIVGGQGDGRVQAGGIVTARFVNEANVRADGGVRVARSTLNSKIHTTGDLLIENGAIISGETYAREGVVARTLGSDAGVQTHVAFGRDPYDLAAIHKLDQDAEKCRETAQQIRAKVMPLMAQAKRLTAEQRERATELLCRADEIETRIDDIKASRDELWESSAPRDKPRLRVMREVFPGVRVSIGLREARIKNRIAGPLVFEERQVNGPTELVVVNERTGSVTVIPTYELDIEQFMKPDPQTGVEADESAVDESDN